MAYHRAYVILLTYLHNHADRILCVAAPSILASIVETLDFKAHPAGRIDMDMDLACRHVNARP